MKIKSTSKKELINSLYQRTPNTEHRTDDKAIQKLFINHANPNAIWYPGSQTLEEIEQILRLHIGEKKQNDE